MSLALAFTNMFSSNLGERQRQRFWSEPINSHDEEAAATPTTTLSRENSTATSDTTENHSDTTTNNNNNATDSNSSSPATAAAINNNHSTAVNMVEVTDVNDNDEDDPFMAYAAARRRRSSTAATMEEDDNDDDAMVEDDHERDSSGIILLNDNDNDDTAAAIHDMSSVSLAELEEERELARRRSSACSMLAVFVLFRLWISCLQQGDLTLFMLCLLGTSWTVRWIRFNREREEELDYRIQQYILQSQNTAAAQNNGGDNNAGTSTTTRARSSGGIIVDRNELRMLSFQAQLSLAIMESQRHMMETGGYGRGDDHHPSTPGVSDRAKTFWKRFSYKSPPPALAEDDKKASSKTSAATTDITTKGTTADNSKLYGSIPSSNPSKKDKQLSDDTVLDDLPHCSICLGDYEDGESLVQLPCGHLYHDSCIASWTTSHTKCPLCNLDLESVVAAAATKNKRHNNHNSGTTSDDSIV